MRILDVIKSANGNLFRSKLRTFLTVIAIFIGSFTIILNTAINTGVNSFIDKQVESFGGAGHLEIAPAALMAQMEDLMGGSSGPREYNPDENSSELNFISDETLEKIEQIDGIKEGSVKPYRSTSAEYITSSETNKKWKLRVNSLPSSDINVDLTTGKAPDVNSDRPEISLLPDYAKALGFKSDEDAVGQTVTLAVKNQATSELVHLEATISGIQAPSVVSLGMSWINTALNEEMFAASVEHLPEEYANRIMFATAEFDPETANIDQIKEALEELGLSGMTVEDQVGMIKTFFDVILIVFSIFGGIALLAASIGIINTLLMSVQERTREIGLMKAMGMSSGKIFLSFSCEAILLGFWGSVLGIVVSMAAGLAANEIARTTFLSQFPTFNLTEFTVTNLLIITGVIMFIAFIAGTMPAAKAAKKDPIEALRYE